MDEVALQRRPRSAGGPKSAGATKTQTYFDSREGRAENNEGGGEQLPAPLVDDDTVEDGDEEPVFTLLGNFEEDGVCEWETTRPAKPQDIFGDEMQFSFAGVCSVFRRLTGKGDGAVTTQSGILCEPGKSTDTPGPICALYSFATSRFGSSDEPKQAEDGTGSAQAQPKTRMKERIWRELSLEPSMKHEEKAAGTEEIATSATPETRPTTAKADESYWMSPGRELVGPEKRGGNLHQEVELTVLIQGLKFSQHPALTAEEEAFARVSDLYEQYRRRVDVHTFHYLVTRLTAILQRISAIQTNTLEERTEFGEATPKSLMVPLLEDAKATTSELVAESECVDKLSSQIKQGWEELLSGGQKGGSTAEFELKTTSLPGTELRNDVNRLLKGMTSAKRVFGRMSRNEQYAAAVPSLQFLDDAESTLSNIEHFMESIELVPTNSDQSAGLIAKEERLRRRRIGSERYFVRLAINGAVVGDTKSVQLEWPTFAVNLSHQFNCKLSRKPTAVCLQIWKSSVGFVPDTLVCTVAIPEDTVDERLQFSSSGADLRQRWKGTVLLSSRCRVKAVKSATPTALVVKMPQQDVSILHQTLIKPPCTENHTRRKMEVRSSQQTNHVSCPERQSMMAFKLHGSEIPFSDTGLVEEPLRLALLRKRNQLGPASVPSPIPVNELTLQSSEIYQEVLRAENGAVASDTIPSDILKEGDAGNRNQVMDILRGAKDLKMRKKKHHVSELVRDVARIRFANDEEVSFPELPKKRSFFPEATTRLPIRNPATKGSLLLTVVSGKNIPVETGAQDTLVGAEATPSAMAAAHGDGITGTGATELNTDFDDEPSGLLVKVKFRGTTYQTKIANAERATGPQWKESFCIPLSDVLQDCSMSALIDETIEISLFDCRVADLRQLGGFYEDEETTTVEHRFLGHVVVPLGTVLREGSIGGLVQCHSPDIVAGYSNLISPEESALPPMAEPERRHVGSSPILQIHATTEPLVVLPPRSRPDYPIKESAEVVSLINQWSSSPEDHCPVLWPNHQGDSFLVSRFLRDQSPPNGFDTLSGAAHYVSRIPTSDGLDRDEDIVLTSQQVVDILSGTRKEHAILLANFFLHLSKNSSELDADVFLAVGFAIPEGETAWVMTKCRRSGEVVLWDATTGSAYSHDDEACPLQKIHYIASLDNIYSNRECAKRPNLLDFDVGNARKWAPLNSAGGTKLISVQDESLRFTPPDTHTARALQEDLCAATQNAIRGWRRATATFRQDIATKISRALETLEEAKLAGHPIRGDVIPEDIVRSKRLFGFTLHEPYTSVRDLLDRVHATEIHRNNHPRVEFVVSVRAFPYPGGIVSLWIFVGTLVPMSK